MSSPTTATPANQYAVGISIGTDSCVVAVSSALTSGRIDVCVNDVGDRVTPTYVAFTSGETHAGLPAKQCLVRQPMQTVPHLLAMLSSAVAGKLRVACEVEVNETEDTVVFSNIDADNEDVKYESPKLLTTFLAKVKETVIDAVCGSSSQVGSLVVAVPRFAPIPTVRRCVMEAGLSANNNADAIHIIYDDSAALLAGGYCVSPSSSMISQFVIVLDWGALSLSVTIYEVCPGDVPKFLVHKHRLNGLAGKKLDEEIALQIAQGFQRKTKLDPMDNARSKRKLLQASETVKKTLSAANTTSAEIEAFCEGIDLKEPFSRVKLESIIRDKKYLDFAEAAVADAIDAVLDDMLPTAAQRIGFLSSLTVSTLGGMFRIPMLGPGVQQVVSALVQARRSQVAASLHADPSSPTAGALSSVKMAADRPGVSSDELAAVGACVQALLALPRLAKSSSASFAASAQIDLANRDTHAGGGNCATTSLLLRSVYLLTGAATSGPWKADLFSSRKSSTTGAFCFSEEAGEVMCIAPQGVPLPCEVELQLEKGTGAAPAIVLFQTAHSAPNPAALYLVPILPTAIQCPADAAMATIVLSPGGSTMAGTVACRFTTADGRPCGEVTASLQGEIE